MVNDHLSAELLRIVEPIEEPNLLALMHCGVVAERRLYRWAKLNQPDVARFSPSLQQQIELGAASSDDEALGSNLWLIDQRLIDATGRPGTSAA